MSRRNVRVDLPIGSIDGTTKLADKILAKHNALEAGTGSPLTGQVDMTVFDNLLTDAKDARVPAEADRAQKEAWNDQALTVIGIGEGQNLQVKNTVYSFVNTVHKFLKNKYKNNEEQAELHGFDVTVSQVAGRRRVNFHVPYKSAQGLLDLAASIINKHNTDGGSSVLVPVVIDMALFETKHNQAVQLRDDAAAADADSQAANQLARNLCGYGVGQTANTPDTLYFYLTQIRDFLLVVHAGNEEQLETWGFPVVVSSSTSTGGAEVQEQTFTINPGQTFKLLDNPTSGHEFMISVTGGSIQFCTGPNEAEACLSGFPMTDGDTFDGGLADMALNPDNYLNGTNTGSTVVTVTFLAEE